MRQWFLRIVLLGLAFAVGVAAAGALFWEKPAKRAVQRGLRMVRLVEDVRELFPHGPEVLESDEWTSKVKAVGSPLWHVRPGYDVERVATGFTYPVNIAFVPPSAKGAPQPDAGAPLFYVNELHGRVAYVTRGGAVHTYADGLVNFDPRPSPKSDEAGLSGLTLVPGSEDLIVTGSFLDSASGLLRNRVMRLISEPGGRRMREMKVLVEFPEFTSPSNQIQQALFGPDGKLYVSVGDAENTRLAMDLTKFGGKILRMEPDGSACKDNPFYEPQNPKSPRCYIFAYGVRNVFDFDFHPQSKHLFATDTGKSLDRIIHLMRGASYGWDGRTDGTRINALFTWGPLPTVSPVGMTINRTNVLGPNTKGRMYVATYGPPAMEGRPYGKQIIEFEVDPERPLLTRTPQTLVEYAGDRKATVLGLAEGPDGLYFTDFFGQAKELDEQNAGLGSVWRVVPSQKTLNLPTVGAEELARLAPAERGRVHFVRNCMPCHRIDGNGGQVGPDLTKLQTSLNRLDLPGYAAEVKELLKSEQSFLVEQRPRLNEVMNAKGDNRRRVWLHHHIEQPKFDNPFATMPSFEALPKEQRADIIEYLMTRK